MNSPKYDIENDMHYLQLLAKSFPNVAAASTEIINLSAILNLPKGTEHFLADIHGEHEAFLHVLKNASGKNKKIGKGTLEFQAPYICQEGIVYADILS